MGRPAVAVIVPVYNRPRAVIEALASIAAQTSPPARLVIVDDGSTDDTAGGVESWLKAAQLPFAADLVRQSNQGVAAAHNRGAALVRGEDILAFLDSDDLWPADYLARLAPTLAADSRMVAVSGDLRVNTGRRLPKLLRCRQLQGHVTELLLQGGQAYPSATLVRAAAFAQAGGFDPRYPVFEDHDLFLRLSLLGLWGCAEGAPVLRRCAVGEADPLTRTLDSCAARDLGLQLARRFLHGGGGGAVVSKGVKRKVMAQLWYQAGRARVKAGHYAEAMPCFRRALRRDPCHLRAWRRLAGTYCRLCVMGATTGQSGKSPGITPTPRGVSSSEGRA